MLPGELVELLYELKAVWLKFPENLLLAHLVQQLDRHVGVFQTEFAQSDAAPRFERSVDGF